MMTLPGAPCIYYGDEVGLQGRHDPDCRRGFPWDEATWDEALLDYHRAATGLRRAQPVLRHGTYRTLAAAGNAMAYGRFADDAAAVIVLNADDAPARLELAADELADANLAPVGLPGCEPARVSRKDDGRFTVEIDGRSGGVLLREGGHL